MKQENLATFILKGDIFNSLALYRFIISIHLFEFWKK